MSDKYSIKDGILINEKGEPIKIDDEEVKLDGVLTKEQVSSVVQERLAANNEKIATLEKAAKKAPELQTLLDDAIEEKASLEEQLVSAKMAAEDEISEAMAQLKTTTQKMQTELESERAGRLHEQLSMKLLGLCGDRFINAAKDVVPKLLTGHRRESILDEASGQPIEGRFTDLFEVEYANAEGEIKKQFFPPEKAIDLFAAQKGNLHYLAGNARYGSGGGEYQAAGSSRATPDFSKMSSREKIVYGLEHEHLGQSTK